MKQQNRATGLRRNGHRWWIRVREPVSRDVRKRSKGTDDIRVVNAISVMLDEFALDRVNGWPWLSRIAAGDAEVIDVYNARVRGELHSQRRARCRRRRTGCAGLGHAG